MRRHLIEEFLLPAADFADRPAAMRYDATQRLSVLPDGRPAVEYAPVAGTVTATKTVGEAEDADTPMLGTTTQVTIDFDTDDYATWAGTNTGTRELGGDVDTDD